MATKSKIEAIRNIGIVAHVDAGKTTTTERILFFTGKTHKIGEVDDGTTVTDWMDQERERGITITSAATSVVWKNTTINLIDTPGHIDFTVEVERSLRVLDAVVVVFCGVGGVEPQSEKVWRQSDNYSLPRIAYINKLDRLGANFEDVLNQLRSRLSNHVLPIQYPIGIESEFRGLIDLIDLKSYYWDKSTEEATIRIESGYPEEYATVVSAYREKLIERVAEQNDELLVKYMENETIEPDEIRTALRKLVIDGKVYPVLCGSSLRNKGIEPLLNDIVAYFPSPVEARHLPAIDQKTGKEFKIGHDADDPFIGYIFKVMADTESRMIYYCRIYSGTLRKGMALFNVKRNCFERIDRLIRISGNKRENIEVAYPGDILALIGLKSTATGDTLCEKQYPCHLPIFTFTEPIVSIAIEPKSIPDQEKLNNTLEVLVIEDPSFRYKIDQETGQTIIFGMGELHLEILVDRLKRFFKVEVRVGKPQVSFRESILETITLRKSATRQEGNKTLNATVTLEVHPNERGIGFTFENKTDPDLVRPEQVELVRSTISDSLFTGISLGYPIVDLGVRLRELSTKEGETNQMIVRIATVEAFTQATLLAHPILLEPVMFMEINVPKEYLGNVVDDINSRKGTIKNIEIRMDNQLVQAYLPLRKTFGYSTDIRSISQGRATYSLLLSHYEEVQDK